MSSILGDPEAPKRVGGIGPKAQAKLKRQENLKKLKLTIRDAFMLIAHGIALVLIGLGILTAAIAFIGIIAWGLYTLIIG